MKPASEALAFRIWALCQPRGWGMTLKDCAEELGVGWRRVKAVAYRKGWSDRFKVETSKDTYYASMASKGGDSRLPSGTDVLSAIQAVIGHSRDETAE
jgi:hypothetical protein